VEEENRGKRSDLSHWEKKESYVKKRLSEDGRRIQMGGRVHKDRGIKQEKFREAPGI